MVMIWADTAEIIDCQPLVYGGAVQDEEIFTDESEPSIDFTIDEPSQPLDSSQTVPVSGNDNKLSITSIEVSVVIAAVVIMVLCIGILFKKKHERMK